MPPKKLRRKLWTTTRRRGYERTRAVAYVYRALAEINERQNGKARDNEAGREAY
jgi:hypothetical protein